MSQLNDKFYSLNMHIYVLYICVIYIYIYILLMYIYITILHIYMYINIYLDSKYQVLDQMLHPKSLLQFHYILLLFLIHCF